MTRGDRIAALAAVATLCVAGSPVIARAQSAEAEVLFRDGRRLIKQGKIAEGCDKLEASEQFETTVGTLLNLGDCRELLGKFASAWAAFRKAESTAKHAGRDDKRQAEAGRRAAALEAKLSNLVIQVEQPIAGLVVMRDDTVVPEAAWNSAVPIDPDTYVIVASAPGYKPWRTEVPIHPQIKRRVVTIPRLEREPIASVRVAAPRPHDAVLASVATPIARAPVRRGGATWTTTRAVSATLALAGAASIATGVYFGLRANDRQRRADATCPDSLCGDPAALRLNHDARSDARLANVLYGVGGATVAAAVVLWFVGTPGERVVAPTFGTRTAGLSFAGRF